MIKVGKSLDWNINSLTFRFRAGYVGRLGLVDPLQPVRKVVIPSNSAALSYCSDDLLPGLQQARPAADEMTETRSLPTEPGSDNPSRCRSESYRADGPHEPNIEHDTHGKGSWLPR